MSKPNREEPVLAIRQLHKRFGEQTILRDITFSLTKGEVAVLIGPSGCGKSTLLRCISGLEEIQQGEIRLQDIRVEAGARLESELHGKAGMVFQSYDLFPHLSVLDNVILAPCKVKKRQKSEAEQEARELLDRVGLLEKADSFPRELSGGQKQRVAIVRALILHPEVLLFDEVTAALDPEMVREVLDVILDLARQERTMLIVTHELAFARAIADRILFLDEGQILEDTPPEEFFREPKTQRARQFLSTFLYPEKD